MSQETLSIALTSQPAVEPVTSTEAKLHLELSGTEYDAKITSLIKEARQQVEHDTDAALITQTWQQKFWGFDDPLFLAKRPIQSISSISYYDSNNTSQSLSSSLYSFDAQRRQIHLAYDQSWPETVSRWDAVTVTFVCGYGDAASDVPEMYKQAMLLQIGYNFENRDMMVSDANSSQRAYEHLISRLIRSSYP